MICGHCGHQNPEEHRCCSMCGERLVVTRDNRSEEPSSLPAVQPEVSGPSFLGLNDEPESNAYYLLEDEKPRMWRGVVLVLVLAVVAVLIGLQFHRELRAQATELYMAMWARIKSAPTADKPQQIPPSEPVVPSPASPEPDSISPSDSATESSSSTATPAESSQVPAISSGAEGNSSSASAELRGEPLAKKPALSEERQGELVSGEEAAPRPPMKPGMRQQGAADPMLVLAQRYLRGHGRPQDCEQGMIYLRQALKKPNPDARSQMGALYATGHCVPLNRVAAYRWFSSALELDPDNIWLSRERDRLQSAR